MLLFRPVINLKVPPAAGSLVYFRIYYVNEWSTVAANPVATLFSLTLFICFHCANDLLMTDLQMGLETSTK